MHKFIYFNINLQYTWRQMIRFLKLYYFLTDYRNYSLNILNFVFVMCFFNSLKYLKYATLVCKDIDISNQSLWQGLKFSQNPYMVHILIFFLFQTTVYPFQFYFQMLCQLKNAFLIIIFTHLCPFSKSKLNLTASTLLHRLVLLSVCFIYPMSGRQSTNWDRKG